MEAFTKRVIEIIKGIPTGKVMTYGQIAKLAGSPRGARQVVRILHSMTKKYQLPWHRVINIKGCISLKDNEQFQTQKYLLQSEGIKVTANGQVNLQQYLFTQVD